MKIWLERLSVHQFFNEHWVELIIIPPVLIGFGYLIFGDNYFSSWRVFGAMTLPWFLFSITISGLCNWWRMLLHQRYIKLEDWWKRLIFSFLGYVSIHVIFFILIFSLLIDVWIEGVSVVFDKLHILVIADFSTLIFITTLYEGITYFGKWKEAISETEQLEKLNIDSQFRSLQSQLNPHFLFNSFNVLSSLIAENPRRAEDFVDELSNVYRYLLRSNDQELATVRDEIRFIHSFFHLLKTRYDLGISLSVEVSEHQFSRRLPALSLQVLVENAVKHNEISLEKPLHVVIEEKEEMLLVQNNIQPRKTRVASNQVGLSNLQQRYELLGVKGFKVNNDVQVYEVILPLI